MLQGGKDEIVKSDWGLKTKEVLNNNGVNVIWKLYDNVAHTVEAQAIEEMKIFNKKCFGF